MDSPKRILVEVPEDYEDKIAYAKYLASSPEVETVTGKYFVREKERRSSDVSYNEEFAKRLWEMSEQMTGLAA